MFISRPARRILRTTPIPDSSADGSEGGRDEFIHIDDFDSSKRRRTLTPPDGRRGKEDPIGLDAQRMLTNRLSSAGSFSFDKGSDSSFESQEGAAETTDAKSVPAPKVETTKPAANMGIGARSTVAVSSGGASKATLEEATWKRLPPVPAPEDTAQKPFVNRKKAVGAPPSSWKTGEEKRGKRAITTFHKRPVYGGPSYAEKPEEKLRTYRAAILF